MKEFKCEYKTPISYIKESPNKYADLLGCFLYFLYIAFGFIHFFTIFASE